MLDLINQCLSLILSNKIARIIFSIAGGLMMALSLAGFGFNFFAWVALVPILLLIKSSDSIKTSLFEASLYFLTFNLISFMWLLALHPLTWQGLSYQESIIVSYLSWITPSLAHTFLILFFCLCLKIVFNFRANKRSTELAIIDIVALAFLWVIIEYKLLLNLGDNLRSFFVPINYLAYSQYKNIYMIQIANIIGAIGIEFFIVLVNLLVSNIFNIQKLNNSNKIYTNDLNLNKKFFGVEKAHDYVNTSAVIILILCAFYFYGFKNIQAYKNKELNNPQKSIAILQADFSAKSTRSYHGFDQLVTLQEQLSLSLVKAVDFLFWTEGAIPRSNYDAHSIAQKLKSITNNFSFGTFITENEKTYNALKNFSFINYDKDLVSLKAITENVEQQNTNFNLNNLQKSKTTTETNYKKNILVSFGEYLPFYDLLPASLKLLAQHSIGSGFSASNEINNITTSSGNYAPSICFEILFPEHIRKTVKHNTSFMVNLNDLSWFKNPVKVFGIELKFLKGYVHRMMLAAATFRAVENNRDLVLASNSGISTVIQATGKHKKTSEVNTITLVENNLTTQQGLSFYNQYGF
jgi:apolipoprotein N-acyltransferase